MRGDQKALACRDARHHPRAIIMQRRQALAERGQVGFKSTGLIRHQAGKCHGDAARGLGPQDRVHPDMRVGGVRIVRIGAQVGAGQGFGHHDHRLAIGGGAGQHIAHAAFQAVAIGEDDIGGQQPRRIGPGGAEQMRVHTLIDQGFGANAVPADIADQIAHHGNSGKRAGLGAVLRQRRKGCQRKKPKAKGPACNG